MSAAGQPAKNPIPDRLQRFRSSSLLSFIFTPGHVDRVAAAIFSDIAKGENLLIEKLFHTAGVGCGDVPADLQRR